MIAKLGGLSSAPVARLARGYDSGSWKVVCSGDVILLCSRLLLPCEGDLTCKSRVNGALLSELIGVMHLSKHLFFCMCSALQRQLC